MNININSLALALAVALLGLHPAAVAQSTATGGASATQASAQESADKAPAAEKSAAAESDAEGEPGELLGSLTKDEMDKVVEFGRVVGQAYACAKKEDRPEMLEDIRMIFNFIIQDIGTDAAFVYAALLGYGASEGPDSGSGGGDGKAKFDCAERLEQWTLVLDEFGLSEVGG